MTMESDSPAPGAPARPDVAALLAEVEASVAARKAQGFYREADVRRIENAAVRLQPALDEAQAEVTARHAALVELWDAKACGITTHRTGLAGRLLVGVKRLVHRLTAPYVNIVLARQTAFNVELVGLLSALIPQHADVRLRLEEAERRIEELEDAAEQAATRPRSADGA